MERRKANAASTQQRLGTVAVMAGRVNAWQRVETQCRRRPRCSQLETTQGDSTLMRPVVEARTGRGDFGEAAIQLGRDGHLATTS